LFGNIKRWVVLLIWLIVVGWFFTNRLCLWHNWKNPVRDFLLLGITGSKKNNPVGIAHVLAGEFLIIFHQQLSFGERSEVVGTYRPSLWDGWIDARWFFTNRLCRWH
jgi:hypothetical protein